MVQGRNYKLHKSEDTKNLLNFESKKIDGFEFTPKNTNEYMDMEVNKMVVINPSFIEKVLKKKIKRKLDLYLQFIVSVIDDEDTDPSNLRYVLDDLERYRRTIINKYQRYLDEKYINLLLKKIELLNNEIKTKLLYMKEPIEKEDEKETRRSR